jgi:ATP phosphoribosyltransferase regulatory subunit HisZ
MPDDDYARGRREGLRLALAVIAAEEARWEALLGESSSWRTNLAREVRHKSLQVAQKRVQTLLNRLTPKEEGEAMGPELAAALDKAGL